ncbi:hypothetical protein SD80_024325 [Scytonema tolypothrichoides VB-61278]|nr:hypothetical protein SD80_024325 [Scytonema tolypothrichoides VB-61278]
MKNLIIFALTVFLFLTIPIEQCIAQNVNQDVSATVVAQVGYTVGTVEMIEDHGFDAQGGAFRGIFLFKGKRYVAWYNSRPNVSIGRHLRLTYLDQPGGNWYSLFNPATQVTAYVTSVKPFK